MDKSRLGFWPIWNPYFGLLLLTALASPLGAAPPEVLKVEPPSWWPRHSVNPVQVLIRGRGLGRAGVDSDAGLRVADVRANAAGTCLLVDVLVDPQAAPGKRTLRVRTREGVADAPFELLAPLARPGRFQGFGPDDVLYLILPDRFANGDPRNDHPLPSRGLLDRAQGRSYHGGDLQGVIDRLPYLAELGVTAIWMTPLYDNVNHLNEHERNDGAPIADYHGYGAVDFYAVDEHLGDLAKLRELVDAAHRLGMKVIQDQVANHTGPYHPWVQEPPTPTWYNGTASRHLRNPGQTWTLADPHAGPDLQRETLEGWFIDVLPDLNQNDPDTARYLIQNSLWWVGMSGLDGIGQDTLPFVPRRFWRDWRAALEREYPGLVVVGEIFDGEPALVSFFQGGAARFDGIDTGIDNLFDFPLFFPLRRAFAQGKPLREVAMTVARDHLYSDPGALVTFAGRHDVARFLSEPGATAEGLNLAYTFLFTTRGIPLVYYGDEVAMRGGGDPDHRRDFPGGGRGDPRSAFEAAARTPEERSVFDHVRRLGALRKELVPLRRGSLIHLAAAEQTYAYARKLEAQVVLVVLNNAATEATVEVGVSSLGWDDGTTLRQRLGGGAVRVKGETVKVTLPPRTGTILSE